jgi:lipid-A-disaccharide synthase
MNREIFLLAGEASGDARGSELIRALKTLNPSVLISGMGGRKMKSEGMEILADVSDMAVVGIVEVLKNYSFFKKTMDDLLAQVEKRQPAAVIGIDYPGFNLRFLKQVRKKFGAKIKTIQYISPQLWAWNEKRKWQMAQYLDSVLCLFPFEPDIYQETGLKAVFVGHPIIERPFENDSARDKNLIALFPGSREKEICSHMSVLGQLKSKFPTMEFRYAASSEKSKSLIRSFAPKAQFSTSEELFRSAYLGVVCSGTATLEAAISGLPICVIYRVAWPTYWMGRALIKVPYLAMPNVLLKKKLVNEYIQSDLTCENLEFETQRLIEEPAARNKIQEGYQEIRRILEKGRAAENAAREILNLV